MVKLLKKQFFSQMLGKNYEYYMLISTEIIDEAFVLYVHDGIDYLKLGNLEDTFQSLLEKNFDVAKKLVFVLIHPGDSIERWNAYHRKGERFLRFTQFMTQEFILKVENGLHTKIKKRGLLGDSLAGTASLNIALQNPALWTHVLLQSAAVSEDEIAEVKKQVRLDWHVYQKVGKLEDDFISPISNHRLFILTNNRKLYNIFVERKVDIQYAESNDDHLWDVWREDLPNALDFFLARG